MSGTCIGTYGSYQAQWNITQNLGNNNYQYSTDGGTTKTNQLASVTSFTTTMPTPAVDQNIKIYVNGTEVAHNPALANTCAPQPPSHNIVVSGTCVQGGAWGSYEAKWNVTTNTQNDTFNYSAAPGTYTGSKSGTGFITPNQTLTTPPVNQTLNISIPGSSYTTTGTMDASKCPAWVEPVAPSLSGSCSLDTAHGGTPFVVAWSVKNED